MNLMHMLLIGPLLFYIGHYGKKTNQLAFHMLGTLILTIPFIVWIPSFEKMSFRLVLNLAHVLIWMPLFGYIAYKGTTLDNSWFGLLYILGIIVIAVHSYLYASKIGLVPKFSIN